MSTKPYLLLVILALASTSCQAVKFIVFKRNTVPPSSNIEHSHDYRAELFHFNIEQLTQQGDQEVSVIATSGTRDLTFTMPESFSAGPSPHYDTRIVSFLFLVYQVMQINKSDFSKIEITTSHNKTCTCTYKNSDKYSKQYLTVKTKPNTSKDGTSGVKYTTVYTWRTGSNYSMENKYSVCFKSHDKVKKNVATLKPTANLTHSYNTDLDDDDDDGGCFLKCCFSCFGRSAPSNPDEDQDPNEHSSLIQ